MYQRNHAFMNYLMTDLKNIQLSRAGITTAFAAFLIALTPLSLSAQDLVLPDFGDDEPQASSNEAAQSSGENDFDFLSNGALDSSGFEAEEFDFEKTSDEIQKEIRGEAFDAALQGLLPLKPNEIRRLLEHFARTQESVELPVYPAPRPEVAVETLSLDPGTKPTAIKVAHGYVTTLNVLDSTGAPWPIEDITWAGNFEVVEFSGESSHFIRISPQSEFAYGNMSIHLTSLQTPLIISLETSRDFVHYRFDAIIPEPGPFAKTSIIESGLSVAAGDVNMAGFLEGVVPQSAKRLSVSGVDGRTSAYSHNGMTYLRTPLTLLSPAWVSSASSADGLRIYALEQAPILLLSEKGKMVRARLSDREDILDE